MICIKIESIFIISKILKTKEEQNLGHPVNCGLVRSDHGLTRFEQKKLKFKQIEKIKILILKFF